MTTHFAQVIGFLLLASLAACASGGPSKGSPDAASGEDAAVVRRDAQPPGGDARMDALPDALAEDRSNPSDETCGNGLDDDGDGQVDEGCSCSPGDHQQCYSGSPSQAGVGDCVWGTQDCENGTWGPCTGDGPPSPELCDERDNDCDGQTDEDNVCSGTPCSAQSVTWDTCSGNAPDAGNGQAIQVDNTAPGRTGRATFQCQDGSWTLVSGDCFLDCPATSVTWGGSCSASLPAGRHGDTQAASYDQGDDLGRATYICQDGSWVLQPGSECGRKFCSYDWGTNVASSGDFVQVYVALTNRSPDPPGLAYWNGRGYTDAEVEAFAMSSESHHEFNNYPDADFTVSHIYETALNRPADQAGHDHWVGEFQSGTYALPGVEPNKFGSFVRAFLDGARADPTDAQALQNRIEVASYYTAQILAHRCPWTCFGRSVLQNVNASSGTAAAKAAIDQHIQQILQQIDPNPQSEDPTTCP